MLLPRNDAYKQTGHLLFLTGVFACLLAALLLLAPTLSFAALPQTTVRYTKAKAAFDALVKNANQAKYRSNWENCYNEFMAIYNEDSTWPNRPLALFRAAETLENLARRSFSNSDAKRACQHYEKLAQAHKKNSLADDALYRAAKLWAALLHDDAKALSLLAQIKKHYPKGDMATDAIALEKTIVEGKNPTLSKRADAKASSKSADKELERIPSDALGKEYASIQKRMQKLSSDPKRSCWRQPWERIESELLAIHKKTNNTQLGAAALFSAAEARERLAECSHMSTDFRSAHELFNSLPHYFPSSSLADDALVRSAQILTLQLNDKRQARRLLTDLLRRYPKGDKAGEARTLLAQITKNETLKKAVLLQLLTWDSVDKNRVQITLELTGKTRYQAKLVSESKRAKKHLFLDLNETKIAQPIQKGVIIKGSLLEGIFVEKKKNGSSVLRFDLRDAKRFDVITKPDSSNLLVTIDARKTVDPKETEQGQNYAENQTTKKTERSIRRVSYAKDEDDDKPRSRKSDLGIAQQLGLSVETIFIDAGHGGKDPGTYHNNIVEKLVALDVAKTLGRLLENTGFQVIYSRTSDKFIPLTQRTAMANAAGADLFISVHVNANEKPFANGFETYFLSLARTPDAARLAALENIGSDRRVKDMQRLLAKILAARVDESQTLAQDIQRVTISRLKRNGLPARNNGIKSAPFHVLVGAQMPAVLVELGYCTNPDEAQKLAKSNYREWLAQGIAEGILAYRDRLARRHTVLNIAPRKKSKTL